MARVLAISSQVARGAIGLSAAVPALQTLEHEVVALPTILLSNHPGHQRFAGERVAPELLRQMLDALGENGWLGGIDAVLTGYLPSAQHVAFARRAVAMVKAANAAAIYVCDAVLGDEPKGLYIAREAAEAIRDVLVPAADVVKMNRFECGWLIGTTVNGSKEAASAAARWARPVAIVTSLASERAGWLGNVHIEADGAVSGMAVQALGSVPRGTGDLLGGLYLGHRLGGKASADAFTRAVTGVALVLERSAGADELQLTRCLRDLGA